MLGLRLLLIFCSGRTLTERIEKAHLLLHSSSLSSSSWIALLGSNSLGCETSPAELGIDPGRLCWRCVCSNHYIKGKMARLPELEPRFRREMSCAESWQKGPWQAPSRSVRLQMQSEWKQLLQALWDPLGSRCTVLPMPLTFLSWPNPSF